MILAIDFLFWFLRLNRKIPRSCPPSQREGVRGREKSFLNYQLPITDYQLPIKKMEVIKLQNVGKTYTHYAHGIDRLLEIITHQPRHQAFIALHPLDLTVSEGQVIGIIGANGAGKSTLLKMVAGTLQPDGGNSEVKGRIAALLELGAGFHPDMTGHENVYLNATMIGLSLPEIDAIYEDIVDFSGIRDFMEQPVKTYSSGMFMRLAFAVATCVEPNILIIDEALSVGDGAFARQSFNRIMEFKQTQKTILFCSHSMYQVEAICDRVIWLDKGIVKMDGSPSAVVSAYNQFLTQSSTQVQAATEAPPPDKQIGGNGNAYITEVTVSVDGMKAESSIDVLSLQSELCLTIGFASDPKLPTPSVGLVIHGADGQMVTSAGTQHDGLTIQRDELGNAKVRIKFPRLALLKGEYWMVVYLLCENAIHLYDQVNLMTKLNVYQKGLELGVVSLPRHWEQI
jgi:lipopolysaccharide transport system ATP-binding protein